MRRLTLLALVSSLFASFAPAHEAADQMAEIAKTFVGSLSPEQKAKACFTLQDDERENWHFVPIERKGLGLREMSPQSELLAKALLSTGLSHRGMMKALTIMSLEEVLFQMEGAADESKRAATREKRDPRKYFVCIFGEPAPKGTWAWRFEGHHLSLSFTIKDGEVLRATPSFFGSNPGEVREGPLAGVRVLANEEELGRQLVKSLTPEQAAKAIVPGDAPKEMLSAQERKINPFTPDGLPDGEMNDAQKALLKRILVEYLGRVRPDLAEEALTEIKKSPASFVWMGGTDRGQPHYYRVQGKTFLLEYDNVQNGANHVHCVWRSFEGDFGRDILGEHLKAEHGK